MMTFYYDFLHFLMLTVHFFLYIYFFYVNANFDIHKIRTVYRPKCVCFDFAVNVGVSIYGTCFGNVFFFVLGLGLGGNGGISASITCVILKSVYKQKLTNQQNQAYKIKVQYVFQKLSDMEQECEILAQTELNKHTISDNRRSS